MADTAAISSPPQKKKLPFKRTVARRKPAESSSNHATQSAAKKEDDDDEDEALNMFHRTKDELPSLIEEQERLVRKKNQDRRSSATTQRSASPDSPNSKRRRVSDEIGVDIDGGVAGSAKRRVLNRVTSSLSSCGSVEARKESPMLADCEVIMEVKGKGKEILQQKDLRSRGVPHPAKTPLTVVSIDDYDDEPVIEQPSGSTVRHNFPEASSIPSLTESLSTSIADIAPPGQATTSTADCSDDELEVLSDAPNNPSHEPPDEFEVYVQRAREREEQAKKVAAAAAAAISAVKDKPDAKDSNPAAAAGGPPIKIMVTSEIPGTKPLIFMRRYTHALGAVRDGFVKHAENGAMIPNDLKSQIFLTWKGNRIYNATSCASLGVNLDEDGQLFGSSFAEMERGLHRGGLHLEAWSEDLYAKYQVRKERERTRFLKYDDEDKLPEPKEEAIEKEEVLIRVTLKTRDYEPLKFKVYPHSMVKDMITTFRCQRKVPAGKDISIHFDGEKLDEDAAVKDTEIEDLDILEVHIKQ